MLTSRSFRESRHVTLSRPYALGKASVRRHNIPISSIPCYEYRQEKFDLKVKRRDLFQIHEWCGCDVITEVRKPLQYSTIWFAVFDEGGYQVR